MTYTIEFKAKNLTMALCKKADVFVPSGMIEEVLPGLISFHDLKENDVKKAMEFIAEHFHNPKCRIAKEYIKGSFVRLEYI